MRGFLRGLLFINIFLFTQHISAQLWIKSVDPRRDVLKDHEVLQNMNDLTDTPKMNFNNLKVLVWNVYKGNKDGLYQDLDALLMDSDLVLMQENYLDDKFKKLYTARKDFDWKMAGSFRDNDGIISGVATASTQRPLKYSFLRSPDTEPVVNTPKMMLVSYYSIPDSASRLLVINIHGINFVGTKSFKRQIDQATKVISTHVGPVLYGGDFNTWNDSRMDYLEAELNKLGLTKILRDPSDSLDGLDHLYQRGFNVLSSLTYNSVNSSDHKPLFFELKLKP